MTCSSEKVDVHYKIKLGTQKRTNFLVFYGQACFKEIINMHAASPAISLFQNIISASLLSKNSENESFSGENGFLASRLCAAMSDAHVQEPRAQKKRVPLSTQEFINAHRLIGNEFELNILRLNMMN